MKSESIDPEKLPKVNNKDSLDRYRNRLKTSMNHRKHEGLDDTWNRLIDLYKGKHFKVRSSEDQLAINLAFSTVNVIAPSVSINNPKISIMARSQENEHQAVITEAVINYWWRHYDFQPEIHRAVKDMLILGSGWAKVGYRFSETDAPRPQEQIDQEYTDLTSQADQAALEAPEAADLLPSDQDIAESIEQTIKVVREDRPFIERVSPFDMFVDPEATCLEDANWICQRIVRSHEDVQRDERYNKKARNEIKPDSGVRDYSDSTSKDPEKDLARVTVYEFYDTKRETVSVFTEIGDLFLVSPEKTPFPFGHPFVMFRNYDVPDQFYPIGDLEQIESLQLELNKTRTQMINHRKQNVRKYFYRKRAFGPDGLAALQNDVDNTLVPVEDDNAPFADCLQPVPREPLDPQLYNYTSLIESDLDRVSGVSEYARGGVPETRRTATEASIMQDASNARASDKLAIVERAIRHLASRLVQLGQIFLTGDYVARVVGRDGSSMWVPYNRDDIQGEFDFEIEAGSTQPRNETIRRSQSLQLLNAIAPFIGTVVDPAEILSHVLREAFGIQNPGKFMAAQGPAGLPPGSSPAGSPGALGPPGETPGPPNIMNQVQPQLQGQIGLNLPNTQ